MSSDGPSAGIEVSDLSFAYARPQVLRSVNLSLARGSAAAIIGPNGSGKTTLISCINFPTPPSTCRADSWRTSAGPCAS